MRKSDSFGSELKIGVFAMGLQILAAIYFLVDGIDDIIAQLGRGVTPEILFECIVALALLLGILVSQRFINIQRRQIRQQQGALDIARGALSEHVATRFSDWKLTKGESEVALFALKGFDIAEIARLRGSAQGTVRAQLSQIYTKSGAGNQAMFVSHFLDDLIDLPDIVDTGH